MDWIKVKVSHAEYEYTDLTDCQFRTWIRAMCLTAVMEKIPSPDDMKRRFNERTLKTLELKLNSHGTSLELILNKVLEDVEYTRHIKSKNRSRMAEFRHKTKECSTLHKPAMSQACAEQDKIREDKIYSEKHTKALLHAFKDKYKSRFNQDYIVSWGKDQSILNDIASVLSEKEVISLMDKFFASKDPFITKAGFTIGVFKSQINKLSSEKGATGPWTSQFNPRSTSLPT